MSEKEDLAAIVAQALIGKPIGGAHIRVAEAVLAAGYRPEATKTSTNQNKGN